MYITVTDENLKQRSQCHHWNIPVLFSVMIFVLFVCRFMLGFFLGGRGGGGGGGGGSWPLWWEAELHFLDVHVIFSLTLGIWNISMVVAFSSIILNGGILSDASLPMMGRRMGDAGSWLYSDQGSCLVELRMLFFWKQTIWLWLWARQLEQAMGMCSSLYYTSGTSFTLLKS